MRKITIVQYRLLHYREELFERLRASCAERGIELRLLYGQPSARELSKRDTTSLPWARGVKNRFLSIGTKDLVWQPFPRDWFDSDLVVLMQESRLISNYPWLFGIGVPRQCRVAYWGHGRNLQSANPSGLRERWKRWLVNKVDWWFAYTSATAAFLAQDGFPAARTSVLNNAIDNQTFVADLAAVNESELQALRTEIGALPGAPVAIYCGSLWAEKRLDFLLAAAEQVHRVLPDFRLVVIGDGPEARAVRDASRTHPWVHWVGAQRGPGKAAWFRLATVYLSPGAVGLHVLDAFCARIPMITTRDALHGPEIAYLVDGKNGLLTDGTEQAYAAAVLALLQDEQRLQALCRAASESTAQFTLDAMVHRFADGIERCLDAPRIAES